MINRCPKKQIKPSMIMSSTGWELCVSVCVFWYWCVTVCWTWKKAGFLICRRVKGVWVPRNTNKHSSSCLNTSICMCQSVEHEKSRSNWVDTNFMIQFNPSQRPTSLVTVATSYMDSHAPYNNTSQCKEVTDNTPTEKTDQCLSKAS